MTDLARPGAPVPVRRDAPRPPARAGSRRPSWLPRLLLLVAGALVMLFPLYWMLVTALSPQSDLLSGDLRFWPSTFTWGNFSRAWNSQPFPAWYANSTAIAVVSVLLTVALNLVAGYVFAKHRFPGRDLLFLLILSTLMIPVQVVMIPQFRIVAELGWLDSYWAVIIPRLAEPLGLFLTRQFMLGIPDELLEAARVDGAGPVRTFRSVVLPLCKPLIAVLVILTFMYRWNEFAWPLIVLKDSDLYTVPIGLAFLQGQYSTDFTGLMAMALLSAVPMLIVFAVFQRYFVEGISRSGLK